MKNYRVHLDAAERGAAECTGGPGGPQNCVTSRGACTTGTDYTIDASGVAVPRATQGRTRSEGERTVEVLNHHVASGTRTHLGYDCITPGKPSTTEGDSGAETATEPIIITVTREEFASLPVQPLTAHAGPDEGWLPVNMVNVLHTSPDVQTLNTTLLGTPVQVRAIPIEYHWDLGDGSTITTTKPGKPFPSQQVTATYPQEGWYDITLTTTFAGQYSIDGGPWEDIDGTIKITSDPIELFSKSLESRLVNGDVPADEHEDPWIPERTPDTEGPTNPNPTHRTI